MSFNYFCLLTFIIFFGCETKSEYTENLELKQYLQNDVNDQIYVQKSWDKTIDLESQIENENGESLKLKQVINGKKTIIVRISNIECGPCVNNDINFLISKDINFIFLVSSKNIRHFKAFCNFNKKHKSYLLKSTLNIPLEHLGKPYIFLLKKDDNKPICYFIPKKEFIDIANQYIAIINNKF